MRKEPDADVLYVAGLQGIAEKNHIPLNEAARVAYDDLVTAEAKHHIPFLLRAYRFLLRQEKRGENPKDKT